MISLLQSSYCISSTVLFVSMTASAMILRKTSLLSIPKHQLEPIPRISNGLIFGLLNISSANYYSMDLSLQQSAELVKNKRVLCNIIESECRSDEEKIANYSKNIKDNIRKI